LDKVAKNGGKRKEIVPVPHIGKWESVLQNVTLVVMSYSKPQSLDNGAGCPRWVLFVILKHGVVVCTTKTQEQ
jgi:hypothetical protein